MATPVTVKKWGSSMAVLIPKTHIRSLDSGVPTEENGVLSIGFSVVSTSNWEALCITIISCVCSWHCSRSRC